MLGLAEQLEIISRVCLTSNKPPLSSQERHALPYLKAIAKAPGITAHQITDALEDAARVTYKMVTNHLLFLRKSGYVENRVNTKDGRTLYWSITKSGEKFLIQNCKEL